MQQARDLGTRSSRSSARAYAGQHNDGEYASVYAAAAVREQSIAFSSLPTPVRSGCGAAEGTLLKRRHEQSKLGAQPQSIPESEELVTLFSNDHEEDWDSSIFVIGSDDQEEQPIASRNLRDETL